jgi:hypothetical protein
MFAAWLHLQFVLDLIDHIVVFVVGPPDIDAGECPGENDGSDRDRYPDGDGTDQLDAEKWLVECDQADKTEVENEFQQRQCPRNEISLSDKMSEAPPW